MLDALRLAYSPVAALLAALLATALLVVFRLVGWTGRLRRAAARPLFPRPVPAPLSAQDAVRLMRLRARHVRRPRHRAVAARPAGLSLRAGIACAACGLVTACTAQALLLQREAAVQHQAATALERIAKDHLRTHATACREAAFAAERAAHAGYPAATASARTARAEMIRDCNGLPPAPAVSGGDDEIRSGAHDGGSDGSAERGDGGPMSSPVDAGTLFSVDGGPRG